MSEATSEERRIANVDVGLTGAQERHTHSDMPPSDNRGMPLGISREGGRYVAIQGPPDAKPLRVEADSPRELIALLTAAGLHSTDVSDAFDTSGMEWPPPD